MKRLNRAQILGAKDVVVEDVLTPEWAPEAPPGATPEEIEAATADRAEWGVTIRNLTGAGRGVFIQTSLEMKKKEDNKQKVDFEIEMLLVCMTAVDEDNVPLFTVEDVKALAEKNANPISRCAAVATRLSGLDKEAKNEVKKP